jgi:hypothetical protein
MLTDAPASNVPKSMKIIFLLRLPHARVSKLYADNNFCTLTMLLGSFLEIDLGVDFKHVVKTLSARAPASDGEFEFCVCWRTKTKLLDCLKRRHEYSSAVYHLFLIDIQISTL